MDFLKNSRRFSFKTDGIDIRSTDFETTASEEGNVLTTVYTFKNGLRVTNIAKKI